MISVMNAPGTPLKTLDKEEAVRRFDGRLVLIYHSNETGRIIYRHHTRHQKTVGGASAGEGLKIFARPRTITIGMGTESGRKGRCIAIGENH